MTFSEYIENLAERHVDIRHKENDEVHFLSSEREKHTALDSVLHYPAVILDRGSGFGYGGATGAYLQDRDYLLFEEVEADYVVNIDSQLYGVVAAIHLSQPYKAVNCRKAFN